MRTRSRRGNGAYLRELRVFYGVSMAEAARQSGTPYATWVQWEDNTARVPGLALAWLNAMIDLKERPVRKS